MNSEDKRQYDCNPSKCDDLDCWIVDRKKRCNKCKWVRPECEFDEEIKDATCDTCRLAKIGEQR